MLRYLFPGQHEIDFTAIKDYLDLNVDYFDEYESIVKNIKDELEQAEPVVEGGSDSESSDEDIPLKKKRKFREKISKIINSKMGADSKKKKVSRKKGKRKKKRSATAKPGLNPIKKNVSSKNITGKKNRTDMNFYNQTMNFKEDLAKKERDKSRNLIRRKTRAKTDYLLKGADDKKSGLNSGKNKRYFHYLPAFF